MATSKILAKLLLAEPILSTTYLIFDIADHLLNVLF